MLTWIRKLLAPPVFVDDEEKSSAAAVLNAITLMLLASTLAYTLVFPLLEPQLTARLILVAPIYPLMLVILVLIRRGQEQLAGGLLITGIWLVLIYTAILNGGVYAPAYSGCIVVVLIAGLLLGRPAGLLTAAVSILAGALMALASDYLPARKDIITPLSTWASQAVFFIVAALLLHLATHSIREALARAQVELNERKRLEAAEGRRRALLETVVSLGKAVAQTTDWQACLRQIYESIRGGLGFERAALFLYDPAARNMRSVLGTNRAGDLEESWRSNHLFDSEDFLRELLVGPTGYRFWADYTGESGLAPADEMYGVRNHAMAAAWAGDKPVGVLAVDNLLTGRAMSEEQLEAFKLFAGYAGLAIENSRLLAETAEALTREQAFNEVARAISEVVEMPELLENVVRRAAALVNADAGWLGLLAADGQSIINSFDYNLPASVQRNPRPKGQGLMWVIIDTRQALLLAEYGRHPQALPDWVAAGTRAYLGVPLVSGEDCLGVLGLASLTPGKEFQARDQALAEAIGRQAGIAIQNARLYQQARQRAEQLSILNEVGRVVSTQRDLPGVLEAIYQQVQRSLTLDTFFVALYNAETDEVSFPLVYDGGRRWQEPAGRLSPTSNSSAVIHSGRPLLHNRSEEALAEPGQPSTRIGDTARRSASLLFAPLRTGEHVIGVISAQSYTLNAYTAEHLALLTGVGHQTAIAIENARLFEAERRRVALLTALHETGLDVNAQLELPLLLQTIVERAVKLFEAPVGGLYLVQPDGQTLEVAAASPRDYQGRQMQFGEGLAGRIAQSGEPLIIDDYHLWPGRAPAFENEADFRSVIGVPIAGKGHILGVLDLVDTRPGRFHRADIETLQLLAAQAAVAIQNARLFEAEQRRVAVFAALHQIGLDLNSQLDLPTLLRTIMERAARLLDAPMGGLYLLLPDGQTLEPVANLPAEDIGAPVRLGEGLVGRVALSGEPLVVTDYREWPGRLASVADPAFRAVVGVPIKWNERPVGVVSVCDLRPGRFGPEDAEIVRLLASQAAVAIQNARLFSATQRQLAELLVLRTVAVAATEALTEDELIERSTRIIGEALFQDYCGVLLVDAEAGVLRVHPSHRGMAESMKLTFVPLGQGVTGRVAASGQAWRLGDVRREPAYLAANPAMRSELCVPLRAAGWIIGVINVESPQVDGFTENDEHLLVTLAGQLAPAIERLRAAAQIRRLNSDLERRVSERTAELEAALKELEAFSYSVSHDLRAPLRSIDGFSQTILDDYHDRLDAEGRRLLQIVRQECQHMGQLIDDLIDLARVTRVGMLRVEVDLSELADSLLAALGQREPDRRVDVRVARGMQAIGDFNLLRIMLDNLLSNAWKFSGRRPRAQIEVGVEPQPDGSRAFFVRDNGAGFNMAFAGKLFGAFQRLHSQVEFEGTGIGLATVQRIISRHGGRVWAAGAVDTGATFYFTLPGFDQWSK